MNDKELFEAQKCFQFVCENCRIDKVDPRSVLFGTTLMTWLDGSMKIAVVGEPVSSQYARIGNVPKKQKAANE